ncbi:MAG: type IV toxin-antitoxin system AbiEi family antitoxin [Prevotellaceae bacterium]|nr:type IV toxin-antitoxin system AbiEi family antitoxin [Prevotellaceae bacterium]
MNKGVSIAEWVEHHKFRGFYTFTLDEVKGAFPSFTPGYIATSLNRLVMQKIIISPARGFYVIIPTEYALTGVVAPLFYIDQMMEFLKRKYYIGLLNAAEFYGAAHQRPQTFTIINTYPEIRSGERSNIRFVFICRKDIEDKFIVRHKSRLGTVNVSSAELTAIDLVANEEKVGGLNRVCSVLNDLVDYIDFNEVDDSIFSIYPIPVYQRLGYILESVLEKRSLADNVYTSLKRLGGRIRTIPFKSGKTTEGYLSENRWKVIENQEIDIDE